MKMSLRCLGLSLVCVLLSGCPFEQLPFDPYSRDFQCSADSDCLDDQFCGAEEPRLDANGERVLGDDGETIMRRICKRRPSSASVEIDAEPALDLDASLPVDAAIVMDDPDMEVEPDLDVPNRPDMGPILMGRSESHYGVGQCMYSEEDRAVSALGTENNAYQSPSSDVCEADWVSGLSEGTCPPAASCAELQILLQSDQQSLPRTSSTQFIKTGPAGEEILRESQCIAMPSSYISPSEDQMVDVELPAAQLVPFFGWEIINRPQIGRGDPCTSHEDCPVFFRCDEGNSHCTEDHPSDLCPGELSNQVQRWDPAFDTDYNRCQPPIPGEGTIRNIRRWVGIRGESMAPFSLLDFSGDVARCVLAFKNNIDEIGAWQNHAERVLRDDRFSPTASMKVSMHRNYHVVARDLEDSRYAFNEPQLHPDYPIVFKGSLTDDQQGYSPLLQGVGRWVEGQMDADGNQMRFKEVVFQLVEPVDLQCVVRDARSVSFEVSFDVPRLGSCQMNPRIFCNPDASPAEIASTCECSDMALCGCSVDAQPFHWICGMNTAADIYARPLCIGEKVNSETRATEIGVDDGAGGEGGDGGDGGDGGSGGEGGDGGMGLNGVDIPVAGADGEGGDGGDVVNGGDGGSGGEGGDGGSGGEGGDGGSGGEGGDGGMGLNGVDVPVAGADGEGGDGGDGGNGGMGNGDFEAPQGGDGGNGGMGNSDFEAPQGGDGGDGGNGGMGNSDFEEPQGGDGGDGGNGGMGNNDFEAPRGGDGGDGGRGGEAG